MPISEQQLSRWANAPGSTWIQNTHQQIRNVLNAAPTLQKIKFDTYLQGSYANSTNIRSDSDVDIVVELQQSWFRDLSFLPADQQAAYQRDHVNATYTFEQFRQDVIGVLQSAYGQNNVIPSNKSIKVKGDPDKNRINADVIPCVQHRVYKWYVNSSQGMHDYDEGMKFYAADGTPIFNFPKLHRKNGEDKNHQPRTNGRYKDLVRILKNIKRTSVAAGTFNPKIAPSYFIECLVYNAPDWIFNQSTYSETLELLLGFFSHQDTDLTTFWTGSHQHLLFGVEPWQWNQINAGLFVNEVWRSMV